VTNGEVKLVCFDLGGVLVRICRSWDEGCRAAGLDVRGEFAGDPSGSNGRRDLSRLHQTGQIACAEFFKRMSEAIGGRYSPDEIERIHDAWLLGEYPGVVNVIDRIHAAGCATAALSNTNLAHWRSLAGSPSIRKLTHALASHELGLVKPDAAIYREAERRFGVASGEILFFDDLEDNIVAARNAGWRALQIDHAGDTAAQISNSLREHGVTW
jgi:HAD superfamily hydrolase (TIGR01509 family)